MSKLAKLGRRVKRNLDRELNNLNHSSYRGSFVTREEAIRRDRERAAILRKYGVKPWC